MTDVKAPKIEFPCRYPIKVMGHASPGFEQEILACKQRRVGLMITINGAPDEIVREAVSAVK